MPTTHSLTKSEIQPNWAFHLMHWSMKIADLFRSPDHKLSQYGIRQGDVLIDYGCGPGRYISKASKWVGDEGKVYAVDIHDLAFKCICRIRKKRNLKNVIPVKAIDYFAPIPENKADLILALDMFHQISHPDEFLNEVHRLIKPGGKLILEDGHQKRTVTLRKVNKNKRWQILTERPKHLELAPLYK